MFKQTLAISSELKKAGAISSELRLTLNKNKFNSKKERVLG